MPTTGTQEPIIAAARQRLIVAAMQLFSQVGYSQATTRAIAKAAQVNEVTLFRQFGSKKGLLMACIEAHNAAGFSATFEAELTGDYPEDIYRMACLQMKDTSSNLDTLRILLCEAPNVAELREAMLVGGRANMTRLRGFFQRQIEAGIVRSDISAEVLVSAFDSLFSSGILFENVFQEALTPHLPTEEMLHPLVDLFVRGTRAIPG